MKTAIVIVEVACKYQFTLYMEGMLIRKSARYKKRADCVRKAEELSNKLNVKIIDHTWSSLCIM